MIASPARGRVLSGRIKADQDIKAIAEEEEERLKQSYPAEVPTWPGDVRHQTISPPRSRALPLPRHLEQPVNGENRFQQQSASGGETNYFPNPVTSSPLASPSRRDRSTSRSYQTAEAINVQRDLERRALADRRHMGDTADGRVVNLSPSRSGGFRSPRARRDNMGGRRKDIFNWSQDQDEICDKASRMNLRQLQRDLADLEMMDLDYKEKDQEIREERNRLDRLRLERQRGEAYRHERSRQIHEEIDNQMMSREHVRSTSPYRSRSPVQQQQQQATMIGDIVQDTHHSRRLFDAQTTAADALQQRGRGVVAYDGDDDFSSPPRLREDSLASPVLPQQGVFHSAIRSPPSAVDQFKRNQPLYRAHSSSATSQQGRRQQEHEEVEHYYVRSKTPGQQLNELVSGLAAQSADQTLLTQLNGPFRHSGDSRGGVERRGVMRPEERQLWDAHAKKSRRDHKRAIMSETLSQPMDNLGYW